MNPLGNNTLWERVLESKARRIAPAPATSNRASALGHPCSRKLTYDRVRWQDKKMHGPGLQAIFDAGNAIEDFVLRQLQDAGFKIQQQQQSFQIPEAEITGRIDAAIDVDGKLYPLDVKSMSPGIWVKHKTPEDFMNSDYVHLRQYVTQIVMYAHMMKAEAGVLVCVNKTSFELHDVWFAVADYPDIVQATVETAQSITRHIRAGTLPERITDLSVCAECPYSHICIPDKDLGAGVSIIDNAQLLADLHEWWDTKRHYDTHDDLDGLIKGHIKRSGLTDIKCGPFSIVVRDAERKSWEWPDENTKKLLGVTKRTPYKVVKIIREGEVGGDKLQPGPGV